MTTRIVERNKVNKLRRDLHGVRGHQDAQHGTLILSPENPGGTPRSHEENSSSRDQLEDTLRRHNIAFQRQKGVYGARENSYVIRRVTLDLSKKLARTFHQDAFIWASGGGDDIGYYERSGDGYDKIASAPRKVEQVPADAVDMFSQLGGQKYRFDFDFGG